MSLWGFLTASGTLPSTLLYGAGATLQVARLARESCLDGRLEELRGRVVILRVRDQLSAALAMIELDGVVRRMVLCPPEVSADYISAVISDAGADAWVGDVAAPATLGLAVSIAITAQPEPVQGKTERRASHLTEWILLTSATTGAPKLVQHTLASLSSAFAGQPRAPDTVVWSTFYDVRRYGGLQILLRALYCGSMVLASVAEPVAQFLARAGEAGVTHISGTASHWRRALMSGEASKIAPRYVRLSGEIADQAILDALHAAYPTAAVAHAFATTEAGVAFEVDDGLAGFPATLLGAPGSSVELKIVGDTLRARSPGNATRYLGRQTASLIGSDGFVDTGDRVELCNGRYYFVGRSGGIINVGGLKVHPEEVEAVINSHPCVRMCLVKARRSPIMGAVVAADVVLADAVLASTTDPKLVREILEHCRGLLAAHKVPTMIRIVPALDVSAAGKLVRPNA
jgi:acyl-coenzyme A synthetase/AMP-(fatty) acid ligase